MLLNLSRLLDWFLALCCLTWSLPLQRKWTRYAPGLLTVIIVLFLYNRSSQVADSVNLNIEDDLIYHQANRDAQVKLVSLKAGISIHIGMTLLFIGQDPHASANAKDTITWILVYSSAPVHFHIVSDNGSIEVIDTIMKRVQRQANSRFAYTVETVDDVFDQLVDHLKTNVPHLRLAMVQEHVATQMLPLILPWQHPSIDRMIFISNHIKFRADIVQLYEYFERFEPQQVMGLALTQNAKFAAAFAVHRHLQPISTTNQNLGLSPPTGWPGFNTGLMIMDLEKMRQSSLFIRYLDLENQFPIIAKYDFKTLQVLPQLDEWLTLVGVEKPQLFFTIPCQWNVQHIMDSDAFEYCRIDIKAMTFAN